MSLIGEQIGGAHWLSEAETHAGLDRPNMPATCTETNAGLKDARSCRGS